ncbi:hypothetical protein ACFSKY_09200 [Azotobacter chroococcum]|uniref:Uncharacterized protein n=1 Tax=Azotobacter chroococcum TaxID=353 RepID=A0A4R1PRR2_9GAMM|nr:hypothetical protein [Azotobacter chroococcum]TBV96169.1 hypothetical protein E0E53_10605 [Azotobacter chroococcum]TCL34303.1 hypothetical protein EV691_102288 [Azotobacter chroococcum]
MSEQNLWSWLGSARERLGVLKYRHGKPVPEGSSPIGEKAEALIVSLDQLKTACPKAPALSELESALHGYLAASIEELTNVTGAMLDHRDKAVTMKQRAEEAEAQVALLLSQAVTEGGDTDYRAMQERAEQAERRARYLEQQLSAQADQQSPQQPPAAGLVFPYATKQLEAMRDAAIEFWHQHDRSTPMPYGIQKRVQIFLAERTGESSRKLEELAKAIKPDDLPKA